MISASGDPEAIERPQYDLAAISILTPIAVPGYRIAAKLISRGIKVVFGNMLMACMTGRRVTEGGEAAVVGRGGIRCSSDVGKTSSRLAA